MEKLKTATWSKTMSEFPLELEPEEAGLESASEEELATREPEIWNGTEVLPFHVERRLEVLQRLKIYKGSERYKEEQKKAAQALKISNRSLDRLMKQYQEQGIEGLMRKERSDQGQNKMSEAQGVTERV